jgi:DNA-binding XRE family transcriptional regulator
MSERLTPGQIGMRIKKLRVEHGYSQEDLAKILGISRSSVVQMEKGTRQVSAIEMSTLSVMLGFSMDRFLSVEYEPPSAGTLVEEPEIEIETVSIRNAVPKLKRNKLETVILYITGQRGALPRMDINLVICMLYFCDFDYYELYEEQLTGLLYTRKPNGPYPEQITEVINNMVDEGKLHKAKVPYHGIPNIKLLPGEIANLTWLNAAEIKVIDRVIDKYAHWPAAALNNLARKELPYRVTKPGESINYELAFYREHPHSARIYDEDWHKE